MTAATSNTTQPIPAQTEPFIDRYRRITTRWWPFIRQLLTATNTNSQNIAAINTDLTTVKASVTTEQVARAAADSALASSITTVETSVAGANARITTTEASINGIEAHWGVDIDVGSGAVKGTVRLDAGATGTTFTVLSDKFIIANSANTAQQMQAFIAGLVAGSSTVGINGSLLVDGTILARSIAADTITSAQIAANAITASEIAAGAVTASKIDVAALSAITADLGTVTAGLIRDSGDTIRFDLPNMKIYRVDGTMTLDFLNKQFTITA